MEKRLLGKTGFNVSPICFGCNVFGWTVNESMAFNLLDAFLQHGGNFLDTADTYSKWAPGNQGGESETMIGNWMKKRGNREHIILATKVGWEMSADKKGLSKAYILKAVEDSLRRLQTDYIDLYQAHKDDPNTPLDETLEAFAQLIKQGKVKAIGASNYSAERLREALYVSEQHHFPAYQTLQPLYNLYERSEFEKELLPVCEAEKLAVIPYYSLASGFLTGKYRTEDDLAKGSRGPGIKKYLNEKGLKILTALDVVATRYETTPTRISLAWLMSRPTVVAPIVSATDLQQLHELIESTYLKLDFEAINELNQAGI